MFLKIPMGIPPWGREELYQVLQEIVNGDIFKSSNYQKQLENKICDLLRVKFCILTDLGRIGLEIGLKALGLQQSDGVILPSYVCMNVLLPILKLGLEPQFVDIGEDLNICPKSVERKIKPNTKAIIVPHLFGFPAPIKEILEIAKQKRIYLIDDAAQSFGTQVKGQYTGTFGDIGILSFGPSKVISSTRGGALITQNPEIFSRIKSIKLKRASEKATIDRFWKCLIKFRYRKYSYSLFSIYKKRKAKKLSTIINHEIKLGDYPNEYIGMSNLDSLLAYLQIKRLNQILNKKKLLGKKLFWRIFHQTPEILLQPHIIRDNIFLKFVIKLPYNITNCYKVIEMLNNLGIEAEGGYTPLHFKFNSCTLPYTENIWSRIITLPMNSNMNIECIEYISHNLKNSLNNYIKSLSDN